jgi:proteasome accessory factor C
VPERRRGSPKTADRLGLMLVVVPYLVQHPGSRLGEVAELFGASPEQLRRDLDLLFMSGLPPYGPGDLIDVDVDQDDRIWITMADHFARPLRLTRSEALALYVRGTELVATPGLPQAPDLASALGKLRETLGPETLDADGLIEVTGGGTAPHHLDLLRAAAEAHHRV